MNPSFELCNSFEVGGMLLEYFKSGEVMSFRILPSSMKNKVRQHRGEIRDSVAARSICKNLDIVFDTIAPESMVQFKRAGDPYNANHSPGVSMRNNSSVSCLRCTGQHVAEEGITTEFTDGRGLVFQHAVQFHQNASFVEINTSVENVGDKEILLEMLSSFSLGMLSPFQPDDGPEKYRIHRVRSAWSNEGRPEVLNFEQCNLEMSWQAMGVRTLRFGQICSIPVKDYFPFVAMEDTDAGVVWGVQLTAPGPWMLEVSRFCDWVNISGGIPDREFGQWTRILKPGERLSGIPAIVSCVKGDVQDVCARLVKYQTEPQRVAEEKSLPVMFNDWCSSWGYPSEANILPMAKALAGTDVRYITLDVGWFKGPDSIDWNLGIGDWNVYEPYYPGGFKKFIQKLRSLGFVPGLWFEFEIMDFRSEAMQNGNLYLTLDGYPIQVGNRLFFDFRKKGTSAFLEEKVISMLRENHIGCVKIDCNAQVNFGCDGPDSKAENLRKHLEGVMDFFLHLRESLPELVIEICASGGHRLSPFWLRYASFASVSDSHEGVELPIIVSDVLSQVAASKNEIWVVLHNTDSEQRLYYSLACGMLGRMCLSGEICELDSGKNAILHSALAFYTNAVPVLLDGDFRKESHTGLSHTHPKGYQIVRGKTPKQELFVIHTFENAPETLQVHTTGKIIGIFVPGNVICRCADGILEIDGLSDFSGLAILLSTDSKKGKK